MDGREKKGWLGLPTLLMDARMRAGMSRAAVAEALGVRRPAIWEIEMEKRGVKAEELAAMAKLYGVSVTWLTKRASSRARDDRAELAAEVMAHLSDDAINRLNNAIRIVTERRSRSGNLPDWE